MLSLEALQKTIARSVLSGNSFGLAPLLEAGQFDPYGRLRVYQNNTRASLSATLMAVFPVTVKLVDERFFRYAASEFVRRNPPREPRLSRYGADFPAFLRTFDGLEDMPFVAETARLEWAIAEALDTAARPARTLADLDRADAEATPDLILQPSLRMLVSHWPVLSIWSAHQDGGEPVHVDASRRRPERIALWRSGERVRFARLPAAQFAFRCSLKGGLGLEKAVSRALAHDPTFDVLGALVGLFGDGLVAHVRFDTTPKN
ncbi:putative DNA-binding domain-containing protein [Mesorhizobium sp. IMUNJ 23232]|uniref:HvfC/BufC family peptide modification chaperone n=1 Tax=Mesorhizobium sp. IMUNJ 23232 TaxID=3376064 RepID=UPI0037884EAC